MPDAQDLVRLSLVSKRQDIINYIEVMCSENFKLTIASDFSAISFPNTKLLLIDASLFGDFDLANLEYGEKYSDFSICILPQNIPAEAINYVEKSFRYILAFPVSIDYFHTYIRKVFTELSRRHKGRLSQKLIQQKIPDSFSGYFCGNSNKIKSIRSQILSAAYSKAPVLILGETNLLNLASLVGQFPDSGSAPGRLIGTGEYALCVTFLHVVNKYHSDGFKVYTVAPPQSVVDIDCISIMKNTKNLEAAQKFVDFMLSVEAQELMSSIDFTMPVNPEAKGAPGSIPVTQLDLIEYDVNKAAAQKDEVLAKWTAEVK